MKEMIRKPAAFALTLLFSLTQSLDVYTHIENAHTFKQYRPLLLKQ